MIVIINPNSTVSMTAAMLATAKRIVPQSEILGWTSHDGPPAIQGREDGDVAVPPLLALITTANKMGAKAIIIGCFDDTGLSEARAISICPVIGIGQAAYHLASLACTTFSVVTTLAVSVPILEKNIASYGLERHLGRVRASGVPVLALETDRAQATETVMTEINMAFAEDDVGCVVLGCAGMVHIAEASDDFHPRRLIDGVQAAVQIASFL